MISDRKKKKEFLNQKEHLFSQAVNSMRPRFSLASHLTRAIIKNKNRRKMG